MVAILVILTHVILAVMLLAVIVGMAGMPPTVAMLRTAETLVPEITTMPETVQQTLGRSSAEGGLHSARTLGRAEMAGSAMVARAVTLDRAAMVDRVLAILAVVKVLGMRRAGMQGMCEKVQAEAVLQASQVGAMASTPACLHASLRGDAVLSQMPVVSLHSMAHLNVMAPHRAEPRLAVSPRGVSLRRGLGAPHASEARRWSGPRREMLQLDLLAEISQQVATTGPNQWNELHIMVLELRHPETERMRLRRRTTEALPPASTAVRVLTSPARHRGPASSLTTEEVQSHVVEVHRKTEQHFTLRIRLRNHVQPWLQRQQRREI